MEAKFAMIVWEPAMAERAEDLPGGLGRLVSNPRGKRAEVRVYDQRDDVAFRKYDHLGCSLGSCSLGWCETDPMGDLFKVFLSVASDGVPLADIHREFLKIEEYAAMIRHTAFFGVEIPDEEF